MPAASGWPAAKSKYYEHLTDWYRATGGDTAQINGITGASVGRGPDARDHARPRRRAVRRRLHAAHRRGRRGHARQPERSRRAADDRGRGHAGDRAPLHRQFRLRHVRRRGHDPSHSTAGRVFWPSLLVAMLSLSGAALSVFPAAERLGAPQAEADLTVAALAERVQAAYPGVEQIRRSPSGRITAYWFDRARPAPPSSTPPPGKAWPRPTPTRSNAGSPICTARCSWATGGASPWRRARRRCWCWRSRAWRWSRGAPAAGGAGSRRCAGPLAGRLHVEIARIAVAG